MFNVPLVDLLINIQANVPDEVRQRRGLDRMLIFGRGETSSVEVAMWRKAD
jgi:hypothetical protein